MARGELFLFVVFHASVWQGKRKGTGINEKSTHPRPRLHVLSPRSGSNLVRNNSHRVCHRSVSGSQSQQKMAAPLLQNLPWNPTWPVCVWQKRGFERKMGERWGQSAADVLPNHTHCHAHTVLQPPPPPTTTHLVQHGRGQFLVLQRSLFSGYTLLLIV